MDGSWIPSAVGQRAEVRGCRGATGSASRARRHVREARCLATGAFQSRSSGRQEVIRHRHRCMRYDHERLPADWWQGAKAGRVLKRQYEVMASHTEPVEVAEGLGSAEGGRAERRWPGLSSGERGA